MKEHEINGNDRTSKTEELRAEVARTRERVAADVDSISNKLSPENLKAEAKHAVSKKIHEGTDQVREKLQEGADKVSEKLHEGADQVRKKLHAGTDKVSEKLHEGADQVRDTVQKGAEQVRQKADQVRETVAEVGGPVVSFVKQNPVPLTLIGVGLGWLVWSLRNNSNRRPDYSRGPNYAALGGSEVYDDWAPDSTYTARRGVGKKLQQKVRGGVESIGRAASDKASLARDKVNELEQVARDRAGQVRDLAERTMDEQPLLLGAVALGAGIAVGLGIPSTQSENQLVGRYRDQLVSGMKQRAQELRGVAEHAVDAAKETVKETVKQDVASRPSL